MSYYTIFTDDVCHIYVGNNEIKLTINKDKTKYIIYKIKNKN